MSNTTTPTVFYRTLNVEGLQIFYREAGPRDAPTVLLLHGFPSSSHMYRNLIPMLADKYHVVAPDFPGYGESSAPSVNDFDYSYERLATVTEKFTEKLNLSSYALYLSDIAACQQPHHARYLQSGHYTSEETSTIKSRRYDLATLELLVVWRQFGRYLTWWP
jgi:alpha-beta hydrolase superfamily lysophospholipase